MPPAQRWLPLGVSLVLLGIYVALRQSVLDFGSDSQQAASEFSVRLVETLQSFALYIKLLFVPTGLHMERTLAGVPGWTAALGGGLLVAVVGITIFCMRTEQRRAAFAFGWFLITWFPISGLFPLNAPMAEHWLYVPMVGFFWGLAEIVYAQLTRTTSPRRAAGWTTGAVFACWVIVLLSLTSARNLDWRSNESLYVATLRENPDSIRVQFNLAVVYQDLLNNPTGALRHYESVVRAYSRRKSDDPSLAGRYWAEELEAYLSLGEINLEAGRYDQSIPQFQTLMGVQPDAQNASLIALAAMGLGRSYLAVGQYESAMEAFQRATELAPSFGAETQRIVFREAPLAAFATRPAEAANP
jgi:hypothetical protein